MRSLCRLWGLVALAGCGTPVRVVDAEHDASFDAGHDAFVAPLDTAAPDAARDAAPLVDAHAHDAYAGGDAWVPDGGPCGGCRVDEVCDAVRGTCGPAAPVTDVAVGLDHACAIRADGALFCWGANTHGELGDGTTERRVTPTRISSISDARVVAAGAHVTCVIDRVGKLACWGANDDGRLGTGDLVGSTTPRSVTSDLDGDRIEDIARWRSVVVYATTTCAVTGSGETYCWGTDVDGRIGDGGTTEETFTIPHRVALADPPSSSPPEVGMRARSVRT